MAVQQNKKSRSKRDMRRSHDALVHTAAVSEDATTGEVHRRHRPTMDVDHGRDRGRGHRR